MLQRCQLQLLGCVCLLTASKLRQCRPIGVDLLVYYTDYSVTAAQIRVSVFFFTFTLRFARGPHALPTARHSTGPLEWKEVTKGGRRKSFPTARDSK